MEYPCLSHHGGTRRVTGSCHQLHLGPATSLLIDCGLEQGSDAAPGAESAALGFDIQGIQALVVTHVHLDHVGRIPALLAAGYRGPILCSEPSARLLPLVLEDAYKLSISSEPAKVARYIDFIRELIVPLPFEQWHAVVDRPGLVCRIRLQRAGHLLGSAYVECDLSVGEASQRWVFSGDLGNGRNPMLRAVEPPRRADLLVLESTYGNRLHPARNERQVQLEAAIDRALADRGTLLIPAFSLGRTQELLYELEDILYRKVLPSEGVAGNGDNLLDWSQLPVILDSPLAQRITGAYRELHAYWSDRATARLSEGRKPLGFEQLIAVDSHAQHQQVVNYLQSTGRPAIVIAGNGMCSGGRIVNYLKAMLGDPRHEVLFVGYQAKGTAGAVIQDSDSVRGSVQLGQDGQVYEIRAKVLTVDGYSGHADQAGLVAFVSQGYEAVRRIVLVHGDDEAKLALRKAIEAAFREQGRVVTVSVP